jgi:hypothetical protein
MVVEWIVERPAKSLPPAPPVFSPLANFGVMEMSGVFAWTGTDGWFPEVFTSPFDSPPKGTELINPTMYAYPQLQEQLLARAIRAPELYSGPTIRFTWFNTL